MRRPRADRGMVMRGFMGHVMDVCLFLTSSVRSFRGLKERFDTIRNTFQNQHRGEVVSTDHRVRGDWSVK